MLGKRGSKKLIVGIIIIFIVLAIVGTSAYIFYFKESKPAAVSTPSTSVPSGPSRCSLVAKNDTYTEPDFDRLKNVMQEQQIVKDVPSAGKISLKFYHFAEGCRIWDKSYILSDGKITEGGGESDIQLWIASSYVDRITETNFCDIIKEARASGDLGQDATAGEATLLWRYKSMLKYRECLGIKISE
ncbi:hypothetical protein A3K73_05290 [Candidatus Pacearchaeota archaeon RBG_13_36_9]|nr:MAG: hypothetical protein A3K73_05290 [Candidatus Pacearchaeota archaeon RBG_13_36_9]